MKTYSIDINCDLGEGFNNEALIMPHITSCNIACGGHAGNKETMKWVAGLAKEHKVLVGAHPSYPDQENFGRTTINISDRELINSIKSQILDLESVLVELHIPLTHIKPHGALYNDVARDSRMAEVFISAIADLKDKVVLYVPYGSKMEEVALINGFKIKYEAFGDRNYNTDGSLVSRNHDNALIQDPVTVLNHIRYMVEEQEVRTVAGTSIKLLADTYCIHGDAPATLQILTYLSQELPKHKIFIKN
ncbi:5-oxoprolinase subunit A [Arenibacter antarcticus]|uniref:5-oxoprolinase subunit PxpA n=1 Tax=Arenibacter antarcticus TaxID=2040469 RepID=A0ABW5VDE3_9FLAO|nr:5-oxoprolinase subunit PxpA [Arenibacter sp. H213]MCM4168230.1 lactam utilization protein LamB [Arenibacter sp. H213]